MELKDLRYFIEVVKYGSFTKAAANMFVSQPTLSKSLKKLESELNVKLFERSTRKLKLTDAGEIVYKQGLKILETTDELMMLLDDLMHLPTGVIKIGVPPLIGTLFFPAIAKRWSEAYPNVTLELVELGAKRIEQLVGEGHVDIGMIVLPTDTKAFHVLPFLTEEFMLFVSSNHELASRKSVAIEELQKENFIVFNREFALHNLIISYCERAGFRPNIVYESSQWDLIAELVSVELGITLLPKMIYKKMDGEKIKMIPLRNPPLWELAIITRKGRYQSFALRQLLSLLSKWRIRDR